MPKTSERAVGIAVMHVLKSRPGGAATVQGIKAELPRYIGLLDGDRAASPSLRDEDVWQKKIRNLKSHEKTAGNIFRDGLVEVISRGVWRITSAGYTFIDSTA